jgi:hypothetical protein
VTGGGVLAAQALNNGDVVEVTTGGGVEVVTAGGEGAVSLLPLGGLPEAPSALAVLNGANGLEALVTSEGSDTVFVYAAAPGAGAIEVLPFETQSDFAAVNSPLALVSTLVTALAPSAAPEAPTAGPQVVNPLLVGVSADTGASADSAGEAFAAGLLDPLRAGDESEAQVDPKLPAGLEEFLTGTTEALQRLVEAARSGTRVDDRPGPNTGVDELLQQLLRSIQNLMSDPGPGAPAPESGPGTGAPNPGPQEMDSLEGRDSQHSADDPGAVDGDLTERADTGVSGDRLGADPGNRSVESAGGAGALDLPQETAATDTDDSRFATRASPLWLLALVPTFVEGRGNQARAPRPKSPISPEGEG